MKKYRLQLVDALSKEAIASSGGVVYVATAGDAQKATLYNADGTAKSNPVALVNGVMEFYTADSVQKVDLYGQAPTGHPFIRKNVFPSGDSSLQIVKSHVSELVIPFSINDTAANTETSTGFVHPTGAAVLPTQLVDVLTADSGIVIDIGTLSSDSGDADGYVDGVSVASTGTVKATLTNGAVTLGALLKVQDSANAGDAVPETNVSMGGKTITYTLASGADTAEGFIRIPLVFGQASL